MPQEYTHWKIKSGPGVWKLVLATFGEEGPLRFTVTSPDGCLRTDMYISIQGIIRESGKDGWIILGKRGNDLVRLLYWTNRDKAPDCGFLRLDDWSQVATA